MTISEQDRKVIEQFLDWSKLNDVEEKDKPVLTDEQEEMVVELMLNGKL